MLALSLTFPAGRYHATPWGRHVNEGAVAWPPDPWRLLRALIATWHHKTKHEGRHHDSMLVSLLEALTGELPQYSLPSATHSHVRHYMPQWKPGDTSLVHDAFTAVDRDDPLYVIWPTLELSAEQTALLDDLLAAMSYLGRAESWVSAVRVRAPDRPVNCMPGNDAVDPETGEARGEIVTLLSPLSSIEYRKIRAQFLTDREPSAGLRATMPESLLEAISTETADLRRQGWSQPPAARRVNYLRSEDVLKPRPRSRKEALPDFTTARYLIVGKPLPRVEDSVRFGELLRAAVMSQAKHEFGEDGVPPALSGHGLEERSDHAHAFYLPWDTDGDGWIDRLLIHVPCRLGASGRRILQRLQRLYIPGGAQWRIALEDMGESDVAVPLTNAAAAWRSITPYLHPWHRKKSFGIQEQIRRECRERGLPELIELEQLEHIRVGNHMRRPIDFHRFRSKRGLTQPDRSGSFWRLRFVRPISGPLGLGFACHFGLGLFAPAEEEP